MIEKNLEIINKLGLHARAAALLVQKASSFDSEVFIEFNGQEVNAKSILGVMMLAVAKGDVMMVRVEGGDEIEAYEAIEKLIHDRFGEGE